MLRYVLVSICLSASLLGFAQTLVPDQQSTADALAIADKALLATGSSAASGYQDAEATGSIRVPLNDPFPVTIRSLGRTAIRIEAQLKEGTGVRIVNSGKGVYTRADGKQRQLLETNLMVGGIEFIPALSFLADCRTADVSVGKIGSDEVNGAAVEVIALALSRGKDESQVTASQEITRHKYFVERSTGLVLKVEYTNFAEDGSPAKAQRYYSDYRNVAGIGVPFRQTTYINGKLFSELNLQQIRFNVGLSSADFVVPEVQP